MWFGLYVPFTESIYCYGRSCVIVLYIILRGAVLISQVIFRIAWIPKIYSQGHVPSPIASQLSGMFFKALLLTLSAMPRPSLRVL